MGLHRACSLVVGRTAVAALLLALAAPTLGAATSAPESAEQRIHLAVDASG